MLGSSTFSTSFGAQGRAGMSHGATVIELRLFIVHIIAPGSSEPHGSGCSGLDNGAELGHPNSVIPFTNGK